MKRPVTLYKHNANWMAEIQHSIDIATKIY